MVVPARFCSRSYDRNSIVAPLTSLIIGNGETVDACTMPALEANANASLNPCAICEKVGAIHHHGCARLPRVIALTTIHTARA